jgi:hypothetical protein
VFTPAGTEGWRASSTEFMRDQPDKKRRLRIGGAVGPTAGNGGNRRYFSGQLAAWRGRSALMLGLCISTSSTASGGSPND